MFPTASMGDFLRRYSAVENVFSSYRVVDYMTHEVYDIVNEQLVKADGLCYDIWRKGTPCHNCISKHTCLSGKRCFKIEFLDGVVFLIVSVPIELNGRAYSLELAADVTDSLFVSSGWKDDNTEIIRLIEDFNNTAVRDSFTGLYNRSYILEQLINFCARTDKQDTLSAVIMNVDNFKSFNQQHGIEMGDGAIMRLAALAKEFSAAADHKTWAGRFGGSSICLFFLDKSPDYVENVRQSIIEKTGTITLKEGDAPVVAEVSVGMAEMSKTDTLEGFIDRLEKSMYADRITKKLEHRKPQ